MSTLKADTIQNTSGGAATLTKQHAAKMWIQATSASSVSTQGSFNVSSLADGGTGLTNATLTNAHSDANYANVHAIHTSTNRRIITTGNTASIVKFSC